MRLIDADALNEEIQSVYVEEKSEDPKWAIGLRYSKYIVRHMPTIDAVPAKEQQPKTGHWLKKNVKLSISNCHGRIKNKCL